jgi:hypothetical protein
MTRRFCPRAALAALALAAVLSRGSVPAARAEPPSGPALARALDRVERHAVEVVLRFRKDLRADAEGASGVDPDSATEIHRRWRMSMRLPGFLVGDRRTVLCADADVAPGTIASAEVVPRGGTAVPARLHGFLRGAAALVVSCDADVAAEPLAFEDGGPASRSGADFVGSLAEGPTGLEAWAEPVSARARRPFGGTGIAFGAAEKPPAGLYGGGASRSAALLLDEEAVPVALRFGGGPGSNASLLRGRDARREVEAAVTFAALEEAARRLARDPRTVAVRLSWRAPDPEDEACAAPPAFARLADPGEPDAAVVRFGLAAAPDLVVVPETLPPPWIERIERVVVEPAGKEPVEGRFAGRVRGFGAFAVRLATSALPSLGAPRGPVPAAGAAFLAHVAAFRGGARRDEVARVRSAGVARGYGDRAWFASDRAVPRGAFLLSLEGEVLGLAADLVPEGLEPSPSWMRRGEEDGTRGVHALWFAEVGGAAALALDLDVRAMPRGAEDSRRLPWLGVECEPVRGALVAAALGVADATRDGARGLVVNHVYAGSPAERAGLARDDVLLWARRTNAGESAPPVDLADAPGALAWTDGAEVPRPWRPRGNALVRLLLAWETGTPYEVGYARAGTVRTALAAVEPGPRDVTSARRARDEGTGLLVKELTYEVRAGLRLAEGAPGVLVAEVLEGSPAALARVLPYEVVREVDGVPAAGPEAFAERLAAARAAGKASVRLVVLRLDRSRFVDLRLEGASDTGAAARRPAAPPGEPGK